MLCDGQNGSFRDHLVIGNIKCQERVTILHQGSQSGVGKLSTVGQSQALDSGANGQGQDAPIVHLIGEGGEVQALDEVAVSEKGLVECECLTNTAMVPPVGASRPVPELINGISRPSFRHQHAVVEVRGGAQS